MTDTPTPPAGTPALREKSPLEDAIDLMWRDIILARKPNYGDWEYGGQAYRHILAEFQEVVKERDDAVAALSAARRENAQHDAEQCAHAAGFKARDEGKALTDNPHDTEATMEVAASWFAGWMERQQQIRTEELEGELAEARALLRRIADKPAGTHYSDDPTIERKWECETCWDTQSEAQKFLAAAPTPPSPGSTAAPAPSNFVPLPAGEHRENAGQSCDTLVGPCACGAWHDGSVVVAAPAPSAPQAAPGGDSTTGGEK